MNQKVFKRKDERRYDKAKVDCAGQGFGVL